VRLVRYLWCEHGKEALRVRRAQVGIAIGSWQDALSQRNS
jgi:hypothetical protein